MFYCNECRSRYGYPLSLARSHGPCEICGAVEKCNDVPSSELPKNDPVAELAQAPVCKSGYLGSSPSRVSMKDRWSNWTWPMRCEFVAAMIDPGSVVLDCGAGGMALERFLPERCTYIPLDKVRRDDRTVVCDLETCESLPECDVAVFCGVLEYIENLDRLLPLLKCKTVIATHVLRGSRKRNWWVSRNHIGTVKVFENAGFELVEKRKFEVHNVYKFRPTSINGDAPGLYPG